MTGPTPRRRASTIATGILLASLLVGCSGDGEEGGAASSSTETAPSTVAGDDIAPPQIVGSAQVVIGERTWDFELSSCGSADGRFTAQGSDDEGATVVVTFLVESSGGSVIVSQGDDSWAAGPAGGTALAEVEVTEGSVAGEGEFSRSTLALDDGEPAPEPEAGTFEAACDA